MLQSHWSFILIMIQTVWVSLGQGLESLNTMQLLAIYGTPGESYDVVTKDGYIITIFRLQPKASKKHPVLLQHGLTQSSNCWVQKKPKSDLALLLWQKGYDVWLGNTRGNTYGKRHVSKTVRDPSFWQFSFHEMAYYDLPAIIDYILNKTKNSDLFYVGHSMGNTMFYVLGSTRPEYNKKIRTMFSFAPVAFFTNTAPWLKLLFTFKDIFFALLKTVGIYEIWPFMKLENWFLEGVCSDDWPTLIICRTVFETILGFTGNLNSTDISLISSRLEAVPVNVLLHYAQLIVSGEFHKLDYGNRKNLKVYGSRRPPSYKLRLVTAPVVLYYSDSDPLSNPKDVNHLAALLPNVTGKFLLRGYNHINYLVANNVTLFYNKFIKLIEDTN